MGRQMQTEDHDGRAQRLKVMRGVQAHTESVIRAYDLKAEIAMLSFVLSVEAVAVLGRVEHIRIAFPRLANVLVLLFLASIAGFIYVLLPRFGQPVSAGHAGRGVLFVDPIRHATVDAYIKALTETDLEREAAHQILQLADICATKRRRFLIAIGLVAVFYCLLVTTLLFT